MKPTMKPTRYKVIVSSLFQACRTEMFWYLLTMLLLALLGPLSLLCRGRLLDAAVSGEGKLFGEMLLFGGIFLLSLLMTYGNRLGRQRMRKKLYGHFSEQVLGKFSRIRYAAYESQEALDTIKRAGDAPQEHILEFFTTFLEAASELIRIFCYGAVFAGLSFWCLILGIPAFGAMLYFDLKRIRLMMGLYEGQTREERLMESYEGALSGKETLYDLRVAGAVPFFLKKRKGLSDRIVKERYRRTIQSQLVYSYGEMATVLWMAVVLFFSVNALLKGKATLGLFVALVGSLQQMAGTFRALGEKYSELQRRAAYVGYYVAFLELAEAPAGKTALTDQEESPAGKTALTEKEALAGKKGTREAAGKGIRFEHVTFTYPGRKEPALRDVSFAMAPGTRTALVGHNGSGKSTLVKLLCGLYQPDSGHIFIDGQDVAQMSPDALRRHFSVVFQDYGKYSFTVRENVELGDVEKMRAPVREREKAVRAALRQGLAEDLAGMLEKPLGTLSPEGTGLSGGQWQRLALSRACYRDSAICVLDEPTASLDPVAENELYANFTEMMRERACILISHRLAVARYTDRILVLEGGRLVEDGTHGSLMEREGVYASMYLAQSHWYASEEQRNTQIGLGNTFFKKGDML
ncbi:ABC transporter ATP-binding protein [uncultured Acetatifactor sp.]|uniref:ABC transporter ATP-binding protein n=1 Tax=uncultured Acetatifactor sp. TaxID=1671927 RepID=UPI00272D5718|nr:ATP-binding cassette domain-containing protein [uncultured Acetatifactor sp.]